MYSIITNYFTYYSTHYENIQNHFSVDIVVWASERNLLNHNQISSFYSIFHNNFTQFTAVDFYNSLLLLFFFYEKSWIALYSLIAHHNYQNCEVEKWRQQVKLRARRIDKTMPTNALLQMQREMEFFNATCRSIDILDENNLFSF